MNLLIEADQKYLEDAKRAAEIAEETAGAMAGTLPILLGLVSGSTATRTASDTMDYWAARLGRFASTYPSWTRTRRARISTGWWRPRTASTRLGPRPSRSWRQGRSTWSRGPARFRCSAKSTAPARPRRSCG